MSSIDNTYFSNENYDFEPLSESELSLVMGGGDDELLADNLAFEFGDSESMLDK